MAMDNAVNTVTRIVTFPQTIAFALKNAVVSILLFPFRMMAAGLRRLGSAGNATLNAVNRALDFLAVLPFRLFDALVQNLQLRYKALVSGVNNQSGRLVDAISASFLGAFGRSVLEAWSKGIVLTQDAIANLQTWQDGAFTAVDKLVRTFVMSLHDVLSKSAVSLTSTQRSLDRRIVTAYDQAYKTTAIYLALIWTKAASSGIVERAMAIEQLKTLSEQLTRVSETSAMALSAGYASANNSLIAYSDWVEALIASLLKALQSQDSLPPPDAAAATI